MRLIVLILLSFLTQTLSAQTDSLGLKKAMVALDKALLDKDSTALAGLLHDSAHYGHSNGWVQTKTDVWSDFVSGKLIYTKLETVNTWITAIDARSAVVRMEIEAGGDVNGKAFGMKLHVLQAWVKNKKGWQLLDRQSVKL